MNDNNSTGLIAGAGCLFMAILGPLLIVILALSGISVADTSPPPVISGSLNEAAVPPEYLAAVKEAGTRCPPDLSAPVIAAQIEAESNWNATASSPAGAQGISQFMPGTWAEWGKDYSGDDVADVFNPIDAIGSQADYMCSLIDLMKERLGTGVIQGDLLDLVLASYNAGPQTVLNSGGVPDIEETREYVQRIISLLPKYTLGQGVINSDQDGPPVSADGTFRQPQDGSGRLDPATLCQIPWAAQGKVLRCDANARLVPLNASFRAKFGKDLRISDAYRDYAAQVRVKNDKGDLAATPGRSNHGWGLAVDISGLESQGTAEYLWLRTNAPVFGWSHPSWAREGGSGPIEVWHWEYVGT